MDQLEESNTKLKMNSHSPWVELLQRMGEERLELQRSNVLEVDKLSRTTLYGSQ